MHIFNCFFKFLPQYCKILIFIFFLGKHSIDQHLYPHMVPHVELQWVIDINRWQDMINCLNEQRVHRIRRIVTDRMDPFQAMSEEEFIERFRFNKITVQNLINDLENQLLTTADQRGKSNLTVLSYMIMSVRILKNVNVTKENYIVKYCMFIECLIFAYTDVYYRLYHIAKVMYRTF